MEQGQIRRSCTKIDDTDTHFALIGAEQGRSGGYTLDEETGNADTRFFGSTLECGAGVVRRSGAQRLYFELVTVKPEGILHGFTIDRITLHKTMQHKRVRRRSSLLSGGESPLHIALVDGLRRAGNGNSTSTGVSAHVAAGDTDIGTRNAQTCRTLGLADGSTNRFHDLWHVDHRTATDAAAD